MWKEFVILRQQILQEDDAEKKAELVKKFFQIGKDFNFSKK